MLYKIETVRQICLDAGADAAGFVEIDRPALASERKDILSVYPKTRSIISLVGRINRENIQSPARYVANEGFHQGHDDLTHVAHQILRRLNQLGVRGVIPPIGFPMDTDRWPGKIWHVSHKPIAVEAGLGRMGINRNVVHPKFGNFILLNSILIDAELDEYDRPLDFNPCFECNLCVGVCPVGAIQADGRFDFSACMTHNYREFMDGFQDWVETVISAPNVEAYKTRFRDSETASLWQSLSFGANYKSAYCMAVCPAGDDVIGNYLPDKREYVQEIVRPLKDKKEPVYVQPGTRAEKIARRNSNKDIRLVEPLNPASPVPARQENPPVQDFDTPKQEKSEMNNPLTCKDIIARMSMTINPTVAGDLTADIQYQISGAEPGKYYLHVENGQCHFYEGETDAPTLTIFTPSEVWLAIAQGELNGTEAMMQGKYRAEGDFELLMKMPKIFQDR